MESEEQQSNWERIKLNKQLLDAISDCGLKNPTAIQRKTIPLIQGGQQVIGIAQTGTGKTAAYLIPIIMKIRYAQPAGPSAIVLVPTKELAVQVATHAKLLAKYTDLRILSVFGGVGLKTQVEALKPGIDLLVATPGRLLELYSQGTIETKSVKSLVIDEADRMMDMGFMPQLKRIFDILPRKRQNLLFSATFPPRVEKLSEDFLEFPQKVEITPQSSVTRKVSQEYYLVPNLKTKINFLEYLLTKNDQLTRVLIFSRTKETANNVTRFIDRKGLGPVRVIHSNKGQNTRLNAINDFRSGEVRILVATDVSARGIDIPKVSHVINFEVPVQYDDYVHRIGRTGRALETGESITLVSPEEEYHLKKIERLINEKIPLKKLPKGVIIEKTPFDESQRMARQIDAQKRKEDPTFKGAFHDKRRK